MSLSELLIIALVSMLVLKPEDLPKIVRKFKELKAFIAGIKQEIISHIDPESKVPPKLEDDLGQMNFYLEKITSLGGDYEGEYSIKEVKECYYQLVQNRIKEAKREQE